MDPHIYGQIIFDKRDHGNLMECQRAFFSANGGGTISFPYGKNGPLSLPYSIYKINLKLDQISKLKI